MKLAGLVFLEVRHRFASALLSSVVLALAVATVTFFVMTASASEHETRIIQRDLGLNLVILPATTDLEFYWNHGYSDQTMPDSYMQGLSAQSVANRLIPMLQAQLNLAGKQWLLTGIAPEIFSSSGAKKPVFGKLLEADQLIVGSLVAAELGLQTGQDFELLGETFTIHQVLPSAGSADDLRIYAQLERVQSLLKLPGRINEIQALECQCSDPGADPLQALRDELAPLLPDTMIIRRENLAEARRQQRRMAENLLAVAAPIMLLLCGLLIAALTALNLRERKQEIGIFHALGIPSRAIAGVFLGRALLLGWIAALIGSLGAWLTLQWVGPQMFHFAQRALAFDASLLGHALWLTPLFAIIAGLVPVALAVTRDPARSLQDM